MTWTLTVTDHGRWSYMEAMFRSLDEIIGLDFFNRRVIAFDGPDVEALAWLMERGPADTVLTCTGQRSGLTANLSNAWSAVSLDDEWVLHVESDFVLHDAPLAEMVDVLEANRDLAQMALVRQPWSAEEHQAGGLLYGPHLQGDLVDEGGWLRQKRIFTLNPFVAHASLLRSLRPGVETSLTAQCLERGLSFGFWGSMTDPPRVEHIGREGGMGSPLWRP